MPTDTIATTRSLPSAANTGTTARIEGPRVPVACWVNDLAVGRAADVADELLADVVRVGVAVADPLHRHHGHEVDVRVPVDPVGVGLDEQARVGSSRAPR